MSKLLRINNLIVSFDSPGGELTAVKGVDLSLDRGQTLALVGESGCGKTVLCKSMLKILCSKGRIKEGEILLDEEDLVPLGEEEMQKKRGGEIGMIFQDPMTSLDPAFSVGEQIAEVLRIHKKMSKAEAASDAVELMKMVKIPKAEERYNLRPYQLSGGMRQRIAIAAALAGEPKLLLADEPTTALDEETQEDILALLKEIREKTGIAILLITHDLSIVEKTADFAAIMKDGKVVEYGEVSEIFKSPQHEYTRKLLSYHEYKKENKHSSRAVDNKVLVAIKDLEVKYRISGKTEERVLHDLDMTICRGEIVGLVGRSGAGKTSIARCIMGLERYGGSIEKAEGFSIEMIFQDTGAAFNDRMTIEEIIAEPLIAGRRRKNGASNRIKEAASKESIKRRVREMMDMVELDRGFAERKPYELSGGQRQRTAIARALITDPDIIIADEPLTGLDVSAQSQIAHLFRKLSEERKLAVLFIAHDLPMVEHVSDRIVRIK